MIGGHILAKSIVAVVEEMRAIQEERQEAIKAQGKLKAIAVLEFSKTQAKVAEKLYNSQVKVATQLYKSQVKLACISIKKAVNELIDKYVEDNRLLVKRLEIIKNESNVLIYISLSKVFIIQKH